LKGYLLDTNIIAFWFNPTHQKHAAVCNWIADLPAEAPLMTSAIVIGEIECGCALARGHKRFDLAGLAEFIRHQLPRVIKVGRSTAEPYGNLKAKLFDKYAPKRRRQGLRLEEIFDPVTAKCLGIQENDLWIAAQAVERNLVLATNDKMTHIRKVAPELAVEDWTRSSE